VGTLEVCALLRKEGPDLEHVEGCDVWRSQLDLLLEHHIIMGFQQLPVAHDIQQERLHSAQNSPASESDSTAGNKHGWSSALHGTF
jgi:hypothetical protein